MKGATLLLVACLIGHALSQTCTVTQDVSIIGAISTEGDVTSNLCDATLCTIQSEVDDFDQDVLDINTDIASMNLTLQDTVTLVNSMTDITMCGGTTACDLEDDLNTLQASVNNLTTIVNNVVNSNDTSCAAVVCTGGACEVVTCIGGDCKVTGYDPNCCVNSGQCDDGNPCTTDTCTANVCVHGISGCNRDSDCPDADICYECACVAVLPPDVACVEDADCDDGVVCTLDFCGNHDLCRNIIIPNCCTSDAMCRSITNNCTQANTCTLSTGICVFATEDFDLDGVDCYLDCDDRNLTIGARTRVYRDQDGDGYGTNTDYVYNCDAVLGYVSIGGDCNDADVCIHPGAVEFCDGVDNNCDGVINGAAAVDCFNNTDTGTTTTVNQLSVPGSSFGIWMAFGMLGSSPGVAYTFKDGTQCGTVYAIASSGTTLTLDDTGSIRDTNTGGCENDVTGGDGSLAEVGPTTKYYGFATKSPDGSSSVIYYYRLKTDIGAAFTFGTGIYGSFAYSVKQLVVSSEPMVFLVSASGSSDDKLILMRTNTIANIIASVSWTSTTITPSGDGRLYDYLDAAIIGGKPAIAARKTNGTPAIIYLSCPNADGSGTWTATSVVTLSGASSGTISISALSTGKPIIAYSKLVSSFQRLYISYSSSLTGGSGTWTEQLVDNTPVYRINPSLGIIQNMPFISYMSQSTSSAIPDLMMMHNCAETPNSGAWVGKTIYSHLSTTSIDPRLAPAIFSFDNKTAIARATSLAIPSVIEFLGR
jgi:hypothetical protein